LFFKNKIKIKWKNKKPIELKRLSNALCLDYDKQRNESVLHFTHNGRNQETRGNYNEKL
jgi:hypothetical protein